MLVRSPEREEAEMGKGFLIMGAWWMGVAMEKWFVNFGWPDRTIFPAIAFTVMGIAAFVYGSLTAPTSTASTTIK